MAEPPAAPAPAPASLEDAAWGRRAEDARPLPARLLNAGTVQRCSKNGAGRCCVSGVPVFLVLLAGWVGTFLLIKATGFEADECPTFGGATDAARSAGLALDGRQPTFPSLHDDLACG